MVHMGMAWDMHGGGEATGKVVTFTDSHCEPTKLTMSLLFLDRFLIPLNLGNEPIDL